MKSSGTGFIKNVGQVFDFNNNPATQVLYSLHGKDVNIFLTSSGLTYSFLRFKNDFSQLQQSEDSHGNVQPKERESFCDIARLDLNLKDVSILKENIREETYTNESLLNYYGSTLGDDALNLHTSSKITIKNIYPNIDWVLKINEKEGFKYDFVVHPGGDILDIQLQYKGNTAIKLNDEKDEVVVYTPLGLVNEGKLICYTNGDNSKVTAAYQLNDNNVSILVNEYDKNQTLVIDPIVNLQLTWSTFFGGNQLDEAIAVTADTINGKIYVVGNTDSKGFSLPILNNGTAYFASNATYTSQTDCFISCFNLAGVQQWSTYYFSTELDNATDVTTDSKGKIYVVGLTATKATSIVQFKTQNANGFFQSTPGGGGNYTDAFIIKFSKTGVLEWATLYGGNGDDHCAHVTCDKQDNVIVVGNTVSTNLYTFNAGGYYKSTFNASLVWDMFIARFDNLTKQNWITYFGSNTYDYVTSVVCDKSSRIIVVGLSDFNASVTLPVYKAPSLTNAYYQATPAGPLGNTNGVIAVFEANTTLKWCTYFGGGNGNLTNIRSVDYNSRFDRIVIAGFTNCGTLPVINNAGSQAYYQNTNPSATNVNTGFVCEFNPDYSRRWCTFLGDGGDNRLNNVSYSDNGHIFVAGYSGGYATMTGSSISTLNSYSLVPFKGSIFNSTMAPIPNDMYIAQFYNDCSLQWATLFGQDAVWEQFNDIKVAGNNVFAVGFWDHDNAPPYNYTVNEPSGFLSTSSLGLGDGFIWKLKNYKGEDLREAGIRNDNQMLFNIYPNPTNTNDVRISLNQSIADEKTILLIDVTGRILLSTKTKENNFSLQLPPNLSGKFVLKVSTDTWVAQQALIKL